MGRILYGWIITGLSALANTLAWSVRSTFALFYVALLQEFGWGRAETALGYSLSWLLLLLFSPLEPDVSTTVSGLKFSSLSGGFSWLQAWHLPVAPRCSGTTIWRSVCSWRPALRAS